MKGGSYSDDRDENGKSHASNTGEQDGAKMGHEWVAGQAEVIRCKNAGKQSHHRCSPSQDCRENKLPIQEHLVGKRCREQRLESVTFTLPGERVRGQGARYAERN